MEKKILELEASLFYYKWIHDRDYLEKILDDEFEEIGQSGKIFHKQECMEGLLSCTEDRDITMLHARCTKITEDVYLVRYVTRSNEKDIFRTSIWRKHGEAMMLYFHQASELKEYDVKMVL